MLLRIAHICLLSIVCLSVGNAYLLNLGELLRIAAIGVGLFAYYWFHLRALQGEASEPPKQMVSILALISVFLFVQFDPAYSGINQLIPQGFVNWYAVVTSILAMIAFASVAVDARRLTKAGAESLASQFSRWDWSVFSAAAIALVLIGVTSLLAEVPARPAHFSISKLLLGVLLYASVVGIYRRRESSPTSQDRIEDRRKWVVTWRVLAGAFCLVALVGLGKSIYAQIRLKNGIDLLQRGLHAEAAESFESALYLAGGRSEESQIALVEALLGLDDVSEAQVQIASARHLYVGSQTLEKRIGDAFGRTGHWDRAIDIYRTEGNKRGDGAYFFDELARVYLRNGQFHDLRVMIKRKNRAPSVELKSTEDRVRLTICLIEAGRYDDAERELAVVTSHSSNDWYVEYARGVLANRTQDWENGAEALQRSVELNPSQTQVRLELGQALLELGDYAAAKEQAVHVLEEDPHRILALGQLSTVHAAQAEGSTATDLVRQMTVQIGYAQWQGPQKAGLGATGACWYDAELFPGELSLSISASGTEANGVWPLMIVSLDQEVIGSVSVNRREVDVYEFKMRVESVGNHRLTVYFPNDSTVGEPGDRNLYVSDAIIQYVNIAR